MKSYQGVEILFFKWFLKVGFMIKYLFSKKLVYPKIFKIWILYQSHAQLVLVNIGAEDLKVFWLVSDVEKEERDNADGPRAKKRPAVFPKDGHLLVKKMKNLSIHVCHRGYCIEINTINHSGNLIKIWLHAVY